MRREEVAWAAGLFDGEGYVGAHVRKTPTGRRNPYITLCVVQWHDPAVIDRFGAAVGIGTRNSRLRGEAIEYKWQASGHEKVQAVVAILWPWLCEPKRRQAARALEGYRDERKIIGVREWRRRSASA